jgi:phage terminase large subunit-like protein
MEDQKENKELFTLDYSDLSREEKIDLLARLNEYDKRLKYDKLSQWFPETGPYRRSSYPTVVDFFKAGLSYKERLLSGGRRSGKSTATSAETTYHITGLYPEWWEGKTFLDGENITIIVLAKNTQATRDITQYKLLGDPLEIGTGMIPKKLIRMNSIRSKHGVPGALDSIQIDRIDGSIGTILFRSAEQGMAGIAGITAHVVHIDEEPEDPNIYDEAVARTATTDGIVYMAASPYKGITQLFQRFLPHGNFPKDNIVPSTREQPDISRWVAPLSFMDAAHISDKEKSRALSSYPEHMIESMIYGIPAVGAGKVFKTLESDFVVQPFEIPYAWPKVFGMDFALFGGFTSAVFAAYDRHNDIIYIYDVYKAKALDPTIHANAIRRKTGGWIPGVIDPSAVRRMQEGVKWIEFYRDLGLDLDLAENSIEIGIAEISKRLYEGRMKVMWNCTPLLEEYRLFRWDDKGKIAKNQEDDVMDAWKYLTLSGLSRAISLKEIDEENNSEQEFNHSLAQQTRNPITGY